MSSPPTPNPSLTNPPLQPAWFDDACVLLDMDNFTKTLSSIKAKGVSPDLLASIISHYASTWLPELSVHEPTPIPSPQNSTATWLKKRFFVETLSSMLPEEKEAIPCDFLLRLLKVASLVGAAPTCMEELEGRVAGRLDEATLKELMIPAFRHTCGTLLDVGMVLRLVRGFVGVGEKERRGSAMVKVGKLVDGYLAEAALDAELTVAEFEEVARALPGYARAIDDGLYRAVDTYIKVHPSTNKQERKALCKLIDTGKLSSEATLHASQNERLPVRSVIQVLFSEQAKLHRVTEWSESFTGSRSPNLTLEPPDRVPSKREALTQKQEMRQLRDDVMRLQIHCHALQAQIEKLSSVKERERERGLFRWSSFLFGSRDVVGEKEGRQTTMGVVRKTRGVEGRPTPPRWRYSLS